MLQILRLARASINKVITRVTLGARTYGYFSARNRRVLITVFSSASSPQKGAIERIYSRATSRGNYSGIVIITLQRAAAALSFVGVSTEVSKIYFKIFKKVGRASQICTNPFSMIFPRQKAIFLFISSSPYQNLSIMAGIKVSRVKIKKEGEYFMTSEKHPTMQIFSEISRFGSRYFIIDGKIFQK